ncbi:MAG: VWA domain-containing protein [Acidobacteria bacterium]|nr:VWA domain-containing protein [Acidobacteriota bacterium]
MKKLIAIVTLAALLALAALAQGSKTPPKSPSKPTPTETQKTKPAPQKPQTKPTNPDDEVPVSDETVRLGTDLVNLFFSAVDRNNRIISNLQQKDITVLENGQPQQLFTFKRESTLPINIAILMDLSGSQEYTFPKEKAAAGEFLRSVIRPNKDSAAILTFQDDVDLVQGLTSRLPTLQRAFEDIQYSRRFTQGSSRRQATALYDAIYITADEVLAHDEIRSRSADDNITRRAMILLTDGVDNASSRKIEDAIDRAWRAGVVIYAIGIGDRFRFEGIREDVLRRLSEETGGRAYFPQGEDDLLEDFRQIENELRSQYLVAYSPSNANRDGSFRRIEVRIAGRDDVRVVHRRGYYAPLEEVKK